MSHRLAVQHSLLLAALFAAAASAQKPTFEWQKRAASIDYGSVPLGKHSLAELPIGGSWRLGANQATVLRLAMPAIVGEAVVAPGAYTVQLQRTGEVACSLVSGEGVRIDGPLGKAAKPTKKLVIDWLKDGAPKASSQAAKLVVQFGDNEWAGGMTYPGSKTVPAGGWKLAVFSLPAERVAARGGKPVPVAALQKDDESGFNLMLGKDDAQLTPWSKPAAMGRPGAGAPAATEADAGTTGAVEALTLDKPATRAHVELLKASLSKGELVVELAFGDEAVRVKAPEPKDGKDAKGK
ncbi:MAG: hypothetical protein ACK58X_08145 [Planctomycetota bacterium]